MVEATRSPVLTSVVVPHGQNVRGMYIHNSHWSYTMTGAGAVSIQTNHLGDPGAFDVAIHRLEVDIVGAISGNPTVTCSIVYDSGDDHEDVSLLLGSWTAQVDSHQVMVIYTPLYVKHGARIQVDLTSGTTDVAVHIEGSFEWI